MKWMIPFVVAGLVGTVGCGGDGSAENNTNNNGTNSVLPNADTVMAVKDKVEDEVVDRLDCSGLIREETRQQVTTALKEADFDAAALVASPEELARFVGAVAASTDASALLVGNVAQIARVGHMPTALGGDWDSLACDEAETADCVDGITDATAGTATSTVVCDAGVPTEVEVGFADGCSLFVTENSGTVALRRDDGAYAFENFSLGSVRQVDGVLKVDLDVADGEQITVGEQEGITIGSNTGKSCEERMTVNTLVASRDAAGLSLDIDAERLSDGKTFSVITPMAPAVFSKARGCSCPDPGAVMDWRWTGFLKGQGEADLRLSYAETANDGSCADVSVEILSWPEVCDGDVTDCGKAAVEQLLGPLVTATCVAR